jgi:uncharacterized protein
MSRTYHRAVDYAVLLYTSADDVADKAPQHFAAHREHWARFQDDGTLVMIGPFAAREGAMAVFTTREAAEDFARADPFVTEGVVASWEVRDWREALT